MISVSKDGTIAVTNLNSGDIHKQIHNFSVNEREKKRCDSVLTEMEENRKAKRRNSFSVGSGAGNLFHGFFYLVKVKSQKVFLY